MDDTRRQDDERKLASILFVDIVESSALVDGLEPDDSLEIFRPAITRMAASVTGFGGTVNRVVGDGLMALFGAPLADEEHALSACAAALDIMRQLAATQPDLRLRIGIHSGEFVVHRLQAGQVEALDAVGAVAHLAARLQQGAAPGTIWISEQTHALCAGRLRTEKLGPQPMRGFARPVEVHRLIDADHTNSRFEAGRAALSPFIGRGRELDAILDAAARAGAGQGSAMLLLGEPGIGKTRLLHEARAAIGGAARVVTARALRWRERSGFHVLRQLLRAMAHDAPDPASAMALAALLGDATAQPAAWQALQPSQRRQAMLDAFATILLATAARGPIVLVVDDIHWLDEDSAEALRLVQPRLQGLPVLMLLSGRPQAVSPLEGVTTLALRPLGDTEAGRLARYSLGEGADDPGRIAHICERCSGNPLFIEQASLAQDPLHLPPDIRVILGERIDALAPAAKRVLETVAALEEPSAVALLAAGAAERMAGEALNQALATLERGGFVTIEGEARLVSCRHALFQEVAYRGLTERRRRALHARIAVAIEGYAEGRLDEHAELLARHSRLGGLWQASLRHAGTAARRALARFANREAAGFIEEAIAAAEQLPREPALLVTMIDLRLLLREPLFRLGLSQRILERLAEAESLAELLQDRARLAQLRIFRSHHAWMLGEHEAALAAITEAEAQAAAEGDAALALRARFQWAMWAMVRGRWEECIEAMRAVAAGADDPAHGGRFGLDAALVVVALGYEARALVDIGRIAEARVAADACLARAEQVARPFSWAFAALADGHVLHGEGYSERAIARLSEGLAYCDKAETDLMRVVGLMLLGIAECGAGHWADAAGHLAESVAMAAAMPFLPLQPMRLAYLARALARLGHGAEARARAEQALAMAQGFGDEFLAGFSRAVLAEAQAAVG